MNVRSGLNPITVYHCNHPRPPLRGQQLLRNALNYTHVWTLDTYMYVGTIHMCVCGHYTFIWELGTYILYPALFCIVRITAQQHRG